MPPPIPDRFRLHVRLGRDGDVEEWLGADTTLDRPVLVRFLGPETSPARRAEFLEAIRDGASISHDHLAAVFAAGTIQQGAYAVEEWSGGVSVANRIAADETLPLEEFLPNAAGLAGALAALHASDIIHGAIDTSAIEFSTAHPAKLHGLGQIRRSSTKAEDTARLADALAAAVTGVERSATSSIRPSDLRDGLPPSVDRALAAAARGDIDAAGLAGQLRAAPTATPVPLRLPPSWRWAIAGGILLGAAIVVAVVGSALRVRPSDSPFLFPAVPVSSTAPEPTAPAATSTTTTNPAASPSGVLLMSQTVYDPFGDASERDADAGLAIDGNAATAWRTERYFEPLPRVKPGVGLAFAVRGSPGAIEIDASDGTRYAVAWAPRLPDDFDEWEQTSVGTVVGGRVSHRLPSRSNGVWLLWLTELPDGAGDDEFYADVFEVRFVS